MSLRSGSDILLDVLDTEEVRHIFGNPGSTELPLIDALATRPEFSYIHALQENVAVGMADGYSRVERRPAFVNLHTLAGLGGGMGNLTNAFANGAPLVVTAGQQHRGHLHRDPLLAGDLVGLARVASKWQHEVRDLGELAVMLRRAFRDALAPPAGPVFLSLPIDVLDELGEREMVPRSVVRRDSRAPGLDLLAERLLAVTPGRLALVVGDEVAHADAMEEMEELALGLGAAVFGAPFSADFNFPTDSPQWEGVLPIVNGQIAKRLEPFGTVFVIGAHVFTTYPYDDATPIDPRTELLQLGSDDSLLGRSTPVDLGVVGGVKESLRVLAGLVSSQPRRDLQAALATREQIRAERDQRLAALIEARSSASPLHPMVAVSAVLDGIPADATIVDEAVSSNTYLRGLFHSRVPRSYLFCRGAGLGWGMPAAIGAQLARPDAPVICVIGDGAAMYSVQALWTAAHHRVPVVFVVLNNRRYRILRDGLVGRRGQSQRTGRYVAMDLQEPDIDYVGIARGMGVAAHSVEQVDDLADAVRAACANREPELITVPISPGQP